MKEHRGIFTDAVVADYLAAEPAMQVDALGDGLWTVSDGKHRSIFAEAETSVIAFDTFGTPGRARAYKRAVADTVPGKPIGTIVYSHDHLDHAGFAADLAPEAAIVADALTAQVVRLREADGQLAPTQVVSGTHNTLSIDGRALELLNPGPTHGSGNLGAWFPEHKLLFMVDTVLPNARYGLMPDYHIGNFVKNMRSLLELDFETFVPGRFELTDRAGFETGCDYIEAVQEACQRAFIEFVPIWVLEAMDGYCKAALGERFGHLDGFAEHVGATAIRIVHHYLMGGWGLEDTPVGGALLADA